MSESVGHDQRASGRFEKAIRLTETTLFTNLSLLICGELAKTVLVKVVELCEYYNFASRSIAKFSLVFKMQSSKVGHIETENNF